MFVSCNSCIATSIHTGRTSQSQSTLAVVPNRKLLHLINNNSLLIFIFRLDIINIVGLPCYFTRCLGSLYLCTPVPTFHVFVSKVKSKINTITLTIELAESICLVGLIRASSIILSLLVSFFTLILDPEKQEQRAIKRAAMAEYYEKHGGGDHH